MYKSLVIIFCCACFTCLSQSSKQIELKFEHLTTNNGLSNNEVSSIYKDEDGYMWFSTNDGLNRYDGVAFKAYRHNVNDSLSVIGKSIKQVCAYDNKNLWVAAHCKGLSLLNKYSNKCINFTADAHNPKKLGSNCDIRIQYDNKGLVWVTNSTFVSVFNSKKQEFTTKYKIPKDSSIIYNSLMVNNVLFMGLNYGIKAFNTITGEVKHYNLVNSSSPAIIVPKLATETNDIFFGSWQMGFFIFNTITEKKINLFKGVTVNDAKVVVINGVKQIWVATGSGLLVTDYPSDLYSLTSESFTLYSHQISNPDGLLGNDLNYIFQDNEGLVWIGSQQGINILNPSHLLFAKKKFSSSVVSEAFLDYYPHHLFVDRDSKRKLNYWMSYWHGAGLLKADTNFNVIKRLNFNKNVSNVFRYAKDTLCIAGWDGIWLYDDAKDKPIKNYSYHTVYKLKETRIDFACKDAEGFIWVGTYNQGLLKLNINDGSWVRYPEGKAPNYIKYSRSDILLLDKKNRLWFSDFSYYNLSTKQFKHFAETETASGILEGKDGTIWLSTENGLFKYYEATGAFIVFNCNDGLKSDYINAIAEDAEGNIWMATSLGLACINPNTNIVRTFTAADGLPNYITNDFLVTLPNGNLLVNQILPATKKIGSFLEINPRHLLKAIKILPFHFTSLQILGKEQQFDNCIDSLQTIEVEEKNSFLSVNFQALQFATNVNLQYRYKLQAKDDWIYLGNKNYITFSYLQSGKYFLQIQATNANGVWMDKTLTLQIIIHPPFWKTKWFYILIGLVTAASILYFVKRRIKAIQAKAALQQQISDLEMKALKAQMNPHFIFNCLSSIQESILNSKTEVAAKYLGKFSKLLRLVLMQSEFKLTLIEDELQYLNLYLELEAFRFDDFQYSINLKDIEDIKFAKIPAMLIQPYIENAIKHGLSHKQGDKLLKILFFASDNSTLKVIIQDNGIGRKQSAIINQASSIEHVSLGTKITNERLALLPKTANVTIEDLYDDNNEPIGTKVVLYIPYDFN